MGARRCVLIKKMKTKKMAISKAATAISPVGNCR